MPGPVPIEFRLCDKIDFTRSECWEVRAVVRESLADAALVSSGGGD